jgi:hypothetical protein
VISTKLPHELKRPLKQMRGFQMALEDCHLSDLGFRGPLFTWSNGRTLECLDRAVANSDWCLLFNVVEVSVQSQCFLDHSPILVSFSHNREVRWNKSRSFHYEASWTKHPNHHDMVKKVWRVKDSSSNKWGVVQKKLQACQKTLQHWAQKSGNKGEAQIQEKLGELQLLQQLADPNLAEAETSIKEELNVLLEQDDLKWRQRAKEDWLRLGDRNTKLFHACANQRSKKKTIQQIMDMHERLCTSLVEVQGAFVNYFQDLFTAGADIDIEPCIRHLARRVTPQMNEWLIAVVLVEEIGMALNQMAHLKATGPDGFPACFYQQNLSIVHKEVCEAVLHFFETGSLDSEINAKNISLIPKTCNSVCVTDFRPISLCNVVYKIISKILANRLKSCLILYLVHRVPFSLGDSSRTTF